MSETNGNGQFTPANSLEPSRNGQTARKAASPRTAYGRAVALQELILSDARTPDLKPITRAALARAFCELEECKRKLKMKPLPGSLRPTDSRPQRKVKEQVTFSPEPQACVVQAPSNSVPNQGPSGPTPQEPQTP